MNYYVGSVPISDELYHHGIKGQHWGIRRYQNPDGSLTAAGKAKYGYTDTGTGGRKQGIKAYEKREDNASYKYNKPGESGWIGAGRAIKSKIGSIDKKKLKKALIISGSVVAAGVAAVAITKAVQSGNAKKGAEIVSKMLSSKNSGFNPKGVVFSVKGDRGAVSGYYSPEYAKFLRNMNRGSLPGAHAKNFQAYSKEYYDFIKKK